MKPYPSYKPSGIEWIGDIPSHWDAKRLKYIASINDDVLDEDTDEDFEMEYVDISSVQNGQLAGKELYRFREAPSRARRRVKNGDIIVSTVRTYLKAIARIKNPISNLVVSTGFAVVRPQKIESAYLGNLFFSEFLIGEIISRSVGVGYPAINSSDIGEIKFPLPPHQEQIAIARFLDDKTVQIDKLVANKQRLIELLKEERTALINDAVSGEGKNWERKKLKWVCTITDCKHITPIYIETGIAVVSTGNVKPYQVYLDSARKVSKADYEQLSEGGRKPLNGDIIYSRNASVGAAALVRTEEDFCLGQDICLVRSNQFQEFLEYAFNSNYFISQLESVLVGSTFRRINIQQINDFEIALPPIEEQVKIVQHIQTETKRIDTTISKVEKEIELLQEYRTALISEVVTGKVKVI